MMIYTDDWAFVHIPKTGGVNFKQRVHKEKIKGEFYYPENTKVPIYYWWHQPISYQIAHNSDLENKQWITIVRHPADRLVSYYFFIKKRMKELYQTNISLLPFEDYIKNNGLKIWHENDLAGYWQKFALEGGIWKLYYPQCYWVIESSKLTSWTSMLKDSTLSLGEKPVWTSNVLTFRMEDQLKDLEDYVGFRFTDTRHNSSIHDSWETYYTDEMREVVYERYREDFESFGYNI